MTDASSRPGGVPDAPGPRPMHPVQRGIRAGIPAAVATFAVAISFGVLARPVIGTVPTIVMSLVVYAGSAQFAALSTIATGGTAGAAIAAGLLINARFLPMGIAAAPALRGGRLRRAVEGQAVVDASWAIASDGRGRFDRDLLLGSTIPQALAWWSGTAIGALGGSLLGDPQSLGLDAIFPAFFLALLVGELRDRRALATALIAAGLALALVPRAPTGAPVVAASVAALGGVVRRPRDDPAGRLR
ncbi:MAG TPA: AzlC family ABC transporter permease [Solirubrobacteraceae bacterium]|nr:AzlC family ABC transporter permease [Solirubrobacteraceae bacterium]